MTNTTEVSRIGQKIRITTPDGKVSTFNDFEQAVRFINKYRLKPDPIIGMPDFFVNRIDKELLP